MHRSKKKKIQVCLLHFLLLFCHLFSQTLKTSWVWDTRWFIRTGTCHSPTKAWLKSPAPTPLHIHNKQQQKFAYEEEKKHFEMWIISSDSFLYRIPNAFPNNLHLVLVLRILGVFPLTGLKYLGKSSVSICFLFLFLLLCCCIFLLRQGLHVDPAGLALAMQTKLAWISETHPFTCLCLPDAGIKGCTPHLVLFPFLHAKTGDNSAHFTALLWELNELITHTEQSYHTLMLLLIIITNQSINRDVAEVSFSIPEPIHYFKFLWIYNKLGFLKGFSYSKIFWVPFSW